MSKSASMYIRIDPEVKANAEAIYSQYGITLTEAVNIFFHQSINVGGLPFDLRPSVPNAETIAAIKEVEEMKKDPSIGKAHTDVDEMMKELLS